MKDLPTRYGNDKFLARLRALLAMAEENELFAEQLYYAANSIYPFGEDSSKENIAEWARLARAHGATTDKDYSGDSFVIEVKFSDNESPFRIVTARETVCTPRIVGTETVEVKDYSACPTKTVEREIVEWDCGTLLD